MNVLVLALAAAQTPFGWRGDGSGRFPDATPPTQWSATKNIRWTAVVGRSYSSPIVAGNLAIVTSEPNLLIAVDRSNGKVRWRVETTPAELVDEKSRKVAEEYKPVPDGTGMAAATPLTDGRNVYAVFANGIVRAVDLDGGSRWIAFIDAERNTSYGRSSSPILVGGRLIVHMTHLYALDPASGKELWVNTEAKSTYGTPAGLKIGDVDVIVTPAGDVVRADDGKSVASAIGRSYNSSPAVVDGVVYYGEKQVCGVRLDAAFKDETVWSGEVKGDVFGSPLVHGGVLFTANGLGDLFAYDAGAKGSIDPLIAARTLLPDSEGPSAFSSVTLAGSYLYLNTAKGDIVVLEATREARLVSKNKLPDGACSTPVFSGKQMFLRDGDRLFCIGD